LVVGYLPVLYKSFATRELVISLLDARAGSPPSAGGLLATTACEAHAIIPIIQQLERWEGWMAQLLENYISFPMLGYFRSQHSNQAWLTALVAIINYATVMSAMSKGSLRLQADLTAAMGRHVLSDVVVIFGLEQSCKGNAPSRLSGQLEQIQRVARKRAEILDVNRLSAESLDHHAAGYEPQAAALSGYFLMSLPPAVPDQAVRDDWRVGILDLTRPPSPCLIPFGMPNSESWRLACTQ
jgi:hypothetical protein